MMAALLAPTERLAAAAARATLCKCLPVRETVPQNGVFSNVTSFVREPPPTCGPREA
jgi:hypothetical protein